jgi:mRNA interferase RelE/StbE
MNRYTVLVNKQSIKFLAKLPEKHELQLRRRLLELEENPRPHDSIQLRGQNNFRLDQGEYRIIYSIQNEILLVSVIKIGKRNDGEVYR